MDTFEARLSSIPLPLALPEFEELDAERFSYGARSEAAVYVGELLSQEVPAIRAGDLRIVALARRPGVLSKVAIRWSDRGMLLAPGIGADHIARVRARLDGERIHVVPWQRSAPGYIAAALGLGEVPPVQLRPGIAHASVLLGEIDVRGIAGWRGLNVLLASALTGWRIRLEPVAATAAWRQLERAWRDRRPIPGTVVGRTERGLRVLLSGLYAQAPGAPTSAPAPGQELLVRVTRLDPDEGRIFVTTRLAPSAQLGLPLA